jgi:hypothetical protein
MTGADVLRRLALGALAAACFLACGHAGPVPPSAGTRAVGRAGASRRPTNGAGGSIGDYTVVYDGRGELRVEASLTKPGALFSVDDGAEVFVVDFEAAGADGVFQRGTKSGRSWSAPPCAASDCRIRYRYALRNASKRLDDLDVASEEGDVLEAPPSTWLLVPDAGADDARIRFRVRTPERTTFATGVFHSTEEPAAWDIELGDLWTAPYSAFGPLRRLLLPTPEPATPLEVELAPGKLAVSDEEVTTWIANGLRAVTGYFGGFPMREALLLLVPARGRWVGEGKTLSGGGGAIFLRLGEHAGTQALSDDWVLVHELTHLAFPSVPRNQDWAEEGLATYVEPFARVRAGLLTPEEAWRGLAEGLPKGEPASGDRGLDRTRTWGRTYWGGALFYTLADVEIRKRTQNRLGLEHALRGILAAGGNNAHRWKLDDAFAAGDAATGVPVLRELHDAMGSSPHPVDLDDLWRQLGIERARGSVHFDDRAPLAAIRRAITTPD